MNKTIVSTAVATALGAISMSANAALTTSSVLEFTDGLTYCVLGLNGKGTACKYGAADVSGSYFSMDTNGNGVTENSEKAAMTVGSAGGVHIGAVSTPGAFSNWNFFGAPGQDYAASAITVVNDDVNNDGGFTKTLDMSGWTVFWNGAHVPMGGCHNGTPTDGHDGCLWQQFSDSDSDGTDDTLVASGLFVDSSLATITCSTASCSTSSTFTLTYAAHVPHDDASNFGGVFYQINMQGHVGVASTIPVPAAVWLFGSGLLGLAGVARRKKSA